MSNTAHIAIDAMGGDLGPRLCVPASQKFLLQHPDAAISLVGDRNDILPCLHSSLPDVNVIHAPQTVEMAEKPSVALRHKTDSSMAVAIRQVADEQAGACVSAGNTGALMAFGLRYLGTLAGIERPAICKALPMEGGGLCWILDLGATVECSADQLLQYAKMGCVIAHQHGISQPRIGLLNVGAEAKKGRELQQQAAHLLVQEFSEQYVGFVEGGDIFRGVVEVVVCDGFTGNTVLKASEGVANLLQKSLSMRFQKSFGARLAGFVAAPIIDAWRQDFNLSRFNGAMFLGLRGVLVKSHGAATEEGFIAAINVAYEQLLNCTVSSIARGLNVR